MKVQDVMCGETQVCRYEEDLNRAAQRMWDHDIGVLPVVDEGGFVLGMITDRDVCMAAYTRGLPLFAIRVEEAMSRAVETCAPGSEVEVALRLMQEARVRRLPVIDAEGRLVGILSLNDLSREADLRRRRGDRQLSTDVADALAAISEPRFPRERKPPERTFEVPVKAPSRQARAVAG